MKYFSVRVNFSLFHAVICYVCKRHLQITLHTQFFPLNQIVYIFIQLFVYNTHYFDFTSDLSKGSKSSSFKYAQALKRTQVAGYYDANNASVTIEKLAMRRFHGKFLK